MTRKKPLGQEFIHQWLLDQDKRDKFDKEMLALVSECWQKDTLDEVTLLKGLMRMSSKDGAQDVAD